MKNKEAIRDRILKIIYRSIISVNELLPTGNKFLLSIDEKLLGPEGKLDSLGYINLVTALEREYEDEFGAAILIGGVEAIEEGSNPFQTVATLADFIYARYEAKFRLSE